MAKAKAAATLTDTLRATIAQRGLTGYRVAQAIGVRPQVVQRFIDGRDLYGATLDKLAAGLGFALVATDDAHPDLAGPRRRRRRPPAPARPGPVDGSPDGGDAVS